MAHFAQIDDNDVVINVIVTEQSFIDTGAMGDPDTWIQTSYNNNFRNMYAGIGYFYNREYDIFLPKKPYESWVFDNINKCWKAPIDPDGEPDAGMDWAWDEYTKSWFQKENILLEGV